MGGKTDKTVHCGNSHMVYMQYRKLPTRGSPPGYVIPNTISIQQSQIYDNINRYIPSKLAGPTCSFRYSLKLALMQHLNALGSNDCRPHIILGVIFIDGEARYL